MGRKHRRRQESTPLGPIGWVAPVQSHPDGDWHVRRIPGAAANKTYRCPGCDQEIPPGTAHIVAWRADRHDGGETRRHWHTPCWQGRDRRRPAR